MNISDYKIVFMGTPAFASHILDGLYKAGFHIVAVVSQPDKEFGRKRILKPSEVKEKALELGIPVLTPNKIKDEYEEILAYEPDLIITAAYGQFIPSVILNYPKFKCINAHGSLLPKYRGASPIESATSCAKCSRTVPQARTAQIKSQAKTAQSKTASSFIPTCC